MNRYKGYIYKQAMEKIAGVEYGFTAYSYTPEEIVKNNKKMNEDDFYNYLDRNGKSDWGIGKKIGKNVNNKAIASIPFNYSAPKLENLMYGGDEKAKNYANFNGAYSGEKDGETWVGGKDSAKRFSTEVGNLVNKIQGNIDQQKQQIEKEMSKANPRKQRIRQLESQMNSERKKLSELKFYNIIKKIKTRSNLRGMNSEKMKNKAALKDINKRIHAAQLDIDGSRIDRNYMRDWKDTIDNTINDKGVNSYIWNWY